jgi:hypothetical protein
MTMRPCGTRAFSSFSETAAVMGCESMTASSPMCMGFALGTYSSPMCMIPNSSFIVANVICKNRNIPKYSHSRERGLSVFEKKRKGEELTNRRGGTDPSWRWQRRWLDSLDEAMVKV